jgi:hypothetical protein
MSSGRFNNRGAGGEAALPGSGVSPDNTLFIFAAVGGASLAARGKAFTSLFYALLWT